MADLDIRPQGSRAVAVWDPLVRIFHWSLVASVLAAYFFTEEGDPPHEYAGYIALGLVALRLVWGFIGGRYARFAQFVPGPAVLMHYARDLLRGREARYLGHNPAGAVMVLALLVMVAASGVTGWMLTTDAWFGVEWVEELHEIVANALMLLVGLHVAGVIYTSLHHRENLIRAMFTGRKTP